MFVINFVIMANHLKSKSWWITWCLLSIVGGVIGFTASEMRRRKISRAVPVELRNYNEPNSPYIMGIEDTVFSKEYLRFEWTLLNRGQCDLKER